MLFELLAQKAAQSPHKAAIIEERRTVTLRELYAKATAIAGYLQRLDLPPGKPIVLGVPASADFHAAFFAIAALGIPSITVLPTGKISAQVVAAEPAAALGDRAFLDAVAARCHSVQHGVEWRRENGFEITDDVGGFASGREFRSEKIFAVSSSGTTGEPKLFFRSAEMVVERAELRAQAHNIGPSDVLLATRPYNNSVAIYNQVVIPVLTGSTIVVLPSFERFRIAQAIEAYRVTLLLAAPFFYETLSSIPKSEVYDFSSVRLCVAGGAPLAPQVGRAFQERFGLPLRQWYAGSHVHPAFLYNSNGPPEAVGHQDGIFPARILTETGDVAAVGEIGEIAFHLPSIAKKWQKPLLENSNRRGDYVLTGDLGRIDAAGFVYVAGRKSAIIKVGGNRVEPAEVEDVLRSHPQVREALVFGSRTNNADEFVEAEVEASGDLLEADLLEYCRERLDAYKSPRRIKIVASLPRNEQGKVIRSLVRSITAAFPSLSELSSLFA